MKKLSVIFAMIIWLGITTMYAQQDPSQKENNDKRMAWWRDARFGMFIHWGLYSIPAGQWKEEKNHAEWIRETAQIPVGEYEKLLTQFNPVKFNAEDWVKLAKDAGMKYIVLTSKHHDGFCLFDSKYTDFDVMSTPFKRDILKELADACRKYDMKICWYHSIMDWHHPDYLPRRSWETEIRPVDGADYKAYFTYLKNQLTEIVTNYGDISILWFDGEWEPTWNHQYATELFNYLRKLKPDMIINNRIDTYRDGMGGLSKNPEALGDYGTPEQEIPENGLPGVDWETCMTMNDHWGYNKFDHNWKPAKELIQTLAEIASKGGNLLLNVGPTSEGLFPQESIDRLKEIGKWMKTNGESVYGTQASPFKDLLWGRCTQKQTGEGSLLYFHVFDWPTDKKLEITNLLNEPLRAYLLSDPDKKPLAFKKTGFDLEIPLPDKAPDEYNSVVVLEVKGKPQVIDYPEFSYSYEEATDNLLIELKTKIEDTKLKIHYTVDGTTPGEISPVFTQAVKMKRQDTFKAIAFYGNEKIGVETRIKLPVSYKCNVILKNEPSEKYKANGAASLTDGNYGTKDFMDKTWLGFEGTDFSATLDLGKLTTINHVRLNFLSTPKSWIFEPTEIIVECSSDGKQFMPLTSTKNDPSRWNMVKGVETFRKDVKPVNTHYVRFTAKNRGVCPKGHPGEGGKAWIFINELMVD
jgi:alpha-L-fucosidase